MMNPGGYADPMASQQQPEDPNAALIAALSKLGMFGAQMGQYQGEQQRNQDNFMTPQAGQHSTGLGAALGGIGDAVRGGYGGYRGSALNDKAQSTIDQAGSARATSLQAIMAQALRQFGQQGQPPGGPDPLAGGAGQP